jgi:hypothetical protein
MNMFGQVPDQGRMQRQTNHGEGLTNPALRPNVQPQNSKDINKDNKKDNKDMKENKDNKDKDVFAAFIDAKGPSYVTNPAQPSTSPLTPPISSPPLLRPPADPSRPITNLNASPIPTNPPPGKANTTGKTNTNTFNQLFGLGGPKK